MCVTASTQNPPSKYDNPFATCWTKPGALQFEFEHGQSEVKLVRSLAALDWRGAIIGPHGSGKSTLLESLKPAICDFGREVIAISLRNGQRRLPRKGINSLRRISNANPVVFIIDGYEQLGWFERWRLNSFCHRKNAGLLVTSHAPTPLPTLVELVPNCALISILVAKLCAEVSTPISAKDVDASLACHGSNVREIFFDLYDRHERKRRPARTRSVATTY
jgi:hypothetical protein